MALLLALIGMLIPLAYGQPVSTEEAMEIVGSGLDGTIGNSELGGIAIVMGRSAVPLIDIIAIVLILRSGFNLVLLQGEEDQINKTRRTVATSFIAILLVNIAPFIRDALFEYETQAAPIIAREVMGIIAFVEIIFGAAIIMMIVISGLRAIVKYGSDEGMTQLRKTIIAMLFGVVFIMFKNVLAYSVVSGSPNGILFTVIAVINRVIGFCALVAAAVVIYAGFMMIANLGNADQYTRARDLLIRVGIGLIIILSSLAIINAVAFI